MQHMVVKEAFDVTVLGLQAFLIMEPFTSLPQAK